MRHDCLVSRSQHMTSPTLAAEPPPWQRHHGILLTMRPALDRSIVPAFLLLSACFRSSVSECTCMHIHSFKHIPSLPLKDVELFQVERNRSIHLLLLSHLFVLYSWSRTVPLFCFPSFLELRLCLCCLSLPFFLTLKPSLFVCLRVCEYKCAFESSNSTLIISNSITTLKFHSNPQTQSP